MTEIKVVGEKHCRQRKGQASAWQGLGMEDQCGRNRGSGASGELRHDVWESTQGGALGLPWLCCQYPSSRKEPLRTRCVGKIIIWLVQMMVGYAQLSQLETITDIEGRGGQSSSGSGFRKKLEGFRMIN